MNNLESEEPRDKQTPTPLSTTNCNVFQSMNAPTRTPSNDSTNDTNMKGTTDTTTTTNHKDLSKATKDGYAAMLEDEVQCLVGGTSEKFVPEPMGEDVTTDLINGLRRFNDAARWKVYFKLLQEEKDKENQSNGNIANNTQEEEQEQQLHNPGLKTNLKPIKINLSAPRADDETERFLLQLEEELLKQALDKIEAKGHNNKSHKIKSLQQKLRNHDNLAAVPTDKTNSFRTVSKSNHCEWVEGHLTKKAKEASREKLADVKEQALQLLHDKVELGVLSDKEESFMQQTVESKATPSPKLLIKDHKNPDNEGNVPTGLAAPATNFTSPRSSQRLATWGSKES